MQTLFIGQSYIDVTFLTDHMPVGDEKYVAQDYAVSFGGNAVTAAFCCAKLGIKPDLLATLANDWLGRMFSDMAAKYDIRLHPRYVKESSLSFIMPNNGKRAIVRCRDDHYLSRFPSSISPAVARCTSTATSRMPRCTTQRPAAKPASSPRSTAARCVRTRTSFLEFIDVAIVAERFCEQKECTPPQIIDYLKSRGCRIGGVTLGRARLPLVRREQAPCARPRRCRSRKEKVIDTSGAGDVFHGAYIYSYLTDPKKKWEEHFAFAQRAAAFKIQHLGNEAGLPTLDDIRNLPFAPEATAPSRPRIVSSH